MQVEREERRKNKKMAATESVRMRTGTVITIPFCCVNAIFLCLVRALVWFRLEEKRGDPLMNLKDDYLFRLSLLVSSVVSRLAGLEGGFVLFFLN